MNGKDVFLGLSYVDIKFIEEAELVLNPKSIARPLSLRRSVLIAATVALTLLLVGCAVVYMLSMQQIKIGQQQSYYDSFEYDPDSGQAIGYLGQEAVTEQVLTLAGIKGSPNYQAAQEWFDFKQEYDPDHSIIMELQSSDSIPEFSEEYDSYNLYSQEMKDKLDEILEKYGLKLIGRTVPFRTEELVCKALGLENILASESDASMELDYAAYQECGNLNMDFTLTIPANTEDAAQETQCHIYYMRKDAFTEDVISLTEIETWKEWNYTTSSGAQVLIFRSASDWRGYIFCDMPNYTVTLRYTFIHEQYSNDADGNMVIDRKIMTDRQIERLADAIDFSIEPNLTEGWELLTEQGYGSGDVIGGYSLELAKVESDGINARITLAITAPSDVNLQDCNGYPISLKPGNRWGLFEPVTEVSGNVPGGFYTEDDGDGRPNTQNVVLYYSADYAHMREGQQPFASGQVWSILWQDLYGSYLNEYTNEPETYLITEGIWSIDVNFENVIAEQLELVTTPLAARAAYGWDMQGNDVYQETMITSIILRPMGASIICTLEDIAPDFLTEGDRCIYAVMNDGSRIPLYGDSAGGGIQNLKSESRIDLHRVEYILLADGTRLDVPKA